MDNDCLLRPLESYQDYLRCAKALGIRLNGGLGLAAVGPLGCFTQAVDIATQTLLNVGARPSKEERQERWEQSRLRREREQAKADAKLNRHLKISSTNAPGWGRLTPVIEVAEDCDSPTAA